MTDLSTIVSTLLPTEYASENETAVAFIEAYYEWLEQNESLKPEDLSSYDDIDTTLDEFVFFFKKKYLADIPTGIADVRNFIKNNSSFYETKGTTKSIQLLLKLLYNVESTVYKPGDDIFTLSSGEWHEPVYLEVTHSPLNTSFVNKMVYGISSNASAIVESIATRTINGVKFDVLYLSNVKGEFEHNERITNNSNELFSSSLVIGSLNQITVVDGGSNNSVGDVVDIISRTGKQAKGQIKTIENGTGRITFDVKYGGYGYTANAVPVISTKIFTTNTVSGSGFERFETIVQPLASVSYISANAIPSVGSNVVGYTTGSLITQAEGTVVSVTSSNSSAGSITIQVNTGDFRFADRLRTSSNTLSAVITGTTEVSAYANVAGFENNLLGVFDVTNSFLIANTPTFVRGLRSNTVAQLIDQKTGSGATFSVSKINNTETVYINTDFIDSSSTGNTVLLDVFLDGRNSGEGEVVDVLIGKSYTLTNTSGTLEANTIVWQTDANGTYTSWGYCGVSNSSTAVLFETHNTFDTALAITSNTGSANISSPVLMGGSGYSNTANVVFQGGGPKITTISVVDGGSGYSNGQHVLSSSGANVSATIITNSSGTITSCMLLDGGKLFTEFPTLTVANTSGTGANLVPVMTVTNPASATVVTDGSGAIVSFDVDTNSGYFNTPALSVEGGTGGYFYPLMNYGFGLQKLPSSTIDNIINSVLTFDYKTIGSIEYISKINPGINYNQSPFISVIEPVINGLQQHDYQIPIENTQGAFIDGEPVYQDLTISVADLTFNTLTGNTTFEIGEQVSQGNTTGIVEYVDSSRIKLSQVAGGTFVSSSNTETYIVGNISNASANVANVYSNSIPIFAKGVVKTSNTSNMFVQRLSLLNSFRANTTIIGTRSSATAKAIAVYQDASSGTAGNNAIVTGTVSSASGIAKTIDIINSGFNYRDAELVDVVNPNTNYVFTGIAKLLRQGRGEGFWRNTNGFLSSNKYLHDGYYYQTYSYEVQTSKSLDVYADVLRKLVHVAGTQMFGKTIIASSSKYTPTLETSILVSDVVWPPGGYLWLVDEAGNYLVGTNGEWLYVPA